jgi:hypothetical protein
VCIGYHADVDAAVVVAIVGALATVSAAGIAAWAARAKKREERSAERLPTSRPPDTAAQVLSGNTITAGRDVNINHIIGDYKLADAPTSLSIDTIGFDVHYTGIVGDRDRARKKAVPTLTVAISNPSAEMLLVPRIELQKMSTVRAFACTFPNDPDTGAMFDTYDRLVDLDDAHATEELLPSPLQLNPRETFAIKLGFQSASTMCYQVRLRAYWKVASAPSGTTTVSDSYWINFGSESSTWQSELREAFTKDELIYVRLWSGWDDLGGYTTQRGGYSKMMCSKASDTFPNEFILFDRRAVLIPELPPRDRFFESSRVTRQGLLISDLTFVDHYHGLAESGHFTPRIPSR